MAPNPKIQEAYRAMKAIGIGQEKVKPVLRRLVKLYEKNWALIEEENYRALADAIFDEDETKASDQKKKPRSRDANEEGLDEEAQGNEEPERPLKRLRLKGQEGPSSVSNQSTRLDGPLLIRPKVEEEEQPGTFSSQEPQPMTGSPQIAAENIRNKSQPLEIQQYTRIRRKQPVSPKPLMIQEDPNPSQPRLRSNSPRISLAVHSNEPTVQPDTISRPKQKVHNTQSLIIPKDEPYTDDMPNFEVPIAVIHPDGNFHGLEPPASECVDERNRGKSVLDVSSETRTNCELASAAEESPSKMEIGSSSLGEVKITLSCNSAVSNFRMPSLDAFMELMKDKCLHSYKVDDPNFSIGNLMNDMCNSILELGTHSDHELLEKSENVLPAVDLLKKPTSQDALHSGDNTETPCIPPSIANGSPNILLSDDVAAQISQLSPVRNCFGDNVPRIPNILVNGCSESNEGDLHSLVVVPQCELTASDMRFLHDMDDITRGEEKAKISWVNEINKEFPPAFQYIPQNCVFRGACVSFSLYQIGDKNCCPTCVDDCLVSSSPCSCADETGCDYAYTCEGRVKQCFLDACVAVNRNPQKHHFFYCKECPVEKSKRGDEMEQCKGHLKRKFIKECSIKCGCNKQHCGNRVVQRGINCKLQVFMTPDGRGWGLRTLEELPKGSFVCEYVGEVLTNIELNERNVNNSKECSYPVLLDAGWGSGVVEDVKALCLDSAMLGNVARFINHRCVDANLVEIPVEVETPDHSYYHVALFTTRKVDAMEELTRDYGVDFDDQNHPIRLFRCLCGSKFCRNIKRSKHANATHVANMQDSICSNWLMKIQTGS